MPKYTVANKINHYHDSGEPATFAHHKIQSNRSPSQRQLLVQQQQQSQEPSARANRATSRAAGNMQTEAETRAKSVSQSILSTKSLANLITITRRPLEPAERRKPKQPTNDDLDDNHYHHKQQAARDHDDTRDHLKPLHQLHHRKQKRIISQKLQLQQQQQNKLNVIDNNNSSNSIGRVAKTPLRRTITTRLATRCGTIMNHKELAFIAFVSLSVALVSLVATGQQAYGLNCYHCSSVDDPGCDEAFASRANYTETDCRKHLGPDKEAKVCRKIVQHIEDKMVVIRSCGYIDEHDEKDRKPMCYKRSGTFAIMMESCNCYENNCNSTLSLVPNLSVLSLAALFCSLWLLDHERKKRLAHSDSC